MILSNEPKCNQWLFVRYPCFAHIFKVRLQCSSAILSCFKTVSFSMYIISTEIKSKSADVLLEMTTILKELRIPQLCSEIEWTLVFSWSHCISFWLKKKMFHSHLKYPVFYLLTEFQSPILKLWIPNVLFLYIIFLNIQTHVYFQDGILHTTGLYEWLRMRNTSTILISYVLITFFHKS